MVYSGIYVGQCVKCGTQENMTFYLIRSKKTDIPACNTCKQEFHNYDQAKLCYKIFGFGLIVNLIFVLLNLQYPYWREEWYRNLWIPSGIICGIISALAVIGRIIIFKRPYHKVSNVRKYVKIEFEGKTKSEYYNKWYIIISVLSLLIVGVGFLLKVWMLIPVGAGVFPLGMCCIRILGTQKRFKVIRKVTLKDQKEKKKEENSLKERGYCIECGRFMRTRTNVCPHCGHRYKT